MKKQTKQVFNPLGFYCAPNSATPDYIVYDDFRMFVAYGLMCCWPSHDLNHPDADCNMARPVTRDDVKELRGYFLDLLETSIIALWKRDHGPGDGDVDADTNSLIIGNEELNQEETFIDWRVCFQDDSIMYTMGCTGCDDEAIWLGYKGIQNRENVLRVLTDANQSIDSEVWPVLVEEASRKIKFYECGICGSLHRADWNGDCREDDERFADPEEMAERLMIQESDLEEVEQPS